jgi:hypothetical protein
MRRGRTQDLLCSSGPRVGPHSSRPSQLLRCSRHQQPRSCPSYSRSGTVILIAPRCPVPCRDDLVPSTRPFPEALPVGARHDVSTTRNDTILAAMEHLETSCPARPLDARSLACRSRRPSDTRGGSWPMVGGPEVAGAIRCANRSGYRSTLPIAGAMGWQPRMRLPYSSERGWLEPALRSQRQRPGVGASGVLSGRATSDNCGSERLQIADAVWPRTLSEVATAGSAL